MCIFGALMRFISALGGTLNVLSGDRLVVLKFSAAASEFVSSLSSSVAS
jgi:hypothetical protein